MSGSGLSSRFSCFVPAARCKTQKRRRTRIPCPHTASPKSDRAPLYPAPAAFRTEGKFPLYKKANRRYNRERNAPRIRLCMELTLRMQGAGAANTRSRIAHFLCPASKLYRFSTESQAFSAKSGLSFIGVACLAKSPSKGALCLINRLFKVLKSFSRPRSGRAGDVQRHTRLRRSRNGAGSLPQAFHSHRVRSRQAFQ